MKKACAKFPDDKAVVIEIAGHRAVIECSSLVLETRLLGMGFSSQNGRLSRDIADELDRKNLARQLVEIDALFSAGRDWSPESLLDLYREQGVIQTPYKVIFWRSPSEFEIIQIDQQSWF